ncbi:hypothetical protein ACHAXR_005248 [Thalassiosira sp. AJA248-18]
MSDRRGDKKSKRRRRDRDRDDDDGIVRGSGVNYSKVADRHVDDERFEKHRQAGSTPSATADAGPAAAAAAGTEAAAKPKVSSQMAAVMRVMAGMEERTIAQKLADSNRPTWEQYKKDNEDKLNISGLDQKKMDAYRKELDEQRDKLLTRGTNHREGKDDRKSKKKKKKKHRRHDDSYSSESDSSGYSSDDGRKSHKRKKHKKKSKKGSRRYDSDSYDSDDDRKKSSKHKKKKDKKRRKGDDGSGSGDSYRLSSFFTKGSDDESR